MKYLAKFAVAALVAIGAVGAAAAPAEARVVVSVGLGDTYMGYNYYRPCSYYFRHDLPAPRRCYSYYRRYHPHLYIYSGFVFRDRVHYGYWRHRNDFRHWRNHRWDRRHRH